jgi:protein involved in polysaccharide export with SLBB domain
MHNLSAFVCAALFLAASLTPAASRGQEELENPAESLIHRENIETPAEKMPTRGTPLDARIDRDTYRLDPGDRLLLSLWGATNKSFELAVTPEGDLLIPAVGPVRVSRLTIAESEQLISDRASSAYRNTRLTLSLLELREFRVHVAGRVKRPGTYLATPADRVNSVIRLAGGVTDSASLRRIELRRSGTVPTLVDLQMFLVAGDTADNPSLQMGDIVTVPIEGDSIGVWGAVHDPGQYEFRQGDTVKRLIRLAGGFRDDAQPTEIEWTSFSVDSAPAIVKKVRIGDLRSPGADPAVHPGDRLLFYPQSEWRLRHSVTLEGEVRFPGVYTIVEGRTRISEVIARAGGITSSASLQNSRILRRKVQQEIDPEYVRLSKIPVSDMRPEEYAYFKTRSRGVRGYLSVDIGNAIDRPGGVDDAPLVDDDLIEIDRRRATVEVAGQVRRPGLIAFENGNSVQFYIEQAGGYSSGAHLRKIRVIKRSTGLWLKPSAELVLEPGDTIFVPEKEPVEWWELFKEGLLVVSQIATTIFIIQSVTR